MFFSQINDGHSSEIIFSDDENGVSASGSSLTAFFVQPSLVNTQHATKVTIRNHEIDSNFFSSFGELTTEKCNHLIFEKCTFPDGFQEFYELPFSNISITNSELIDKDFERLFCCLNPYKLTGNLDLSNNKMGKDEVTIMEVLSQKLPDIFAVDTLNFSGNPMRKDFVKELQEEYKGRTEIIYDGIS
jgi:hypothetical protein